MKHPADFKPGTRHFILFAAAALLLLLAAWASRTAGLVRDRQMRKELMRQAVAVAAAMPVEEALALSFTIADLERPEYHRLCALFKAFSAFTGIKSLYTLALREDGTLVFGPESLEPESPGDPYLQPSTDDFLPFKTGKPVLTGPFTDEYGSFVSAAAPVMHPRTGHVLFTVGIDIETPEWQAEIRRARQLPLLLVLIPLAILGTGGLLMKWRHQSPAESSRHLHHLEPILCAGIALLLTLAAALFTARKEQHHRRDNFHSTAQLKAAAYAFDFHNIAENIRMLARFFEASEYVTAAEFARVCEPIMQNHAIEGCVWLPEVPAAGRADFEAVMQAEGLPGFSIRPLPGADGINTPDVLYPAVYIVSDGEEKEKALGYDLASEPVRRVALLAALHSGQITATDPVRLAALPEAPDGLFLFHPVTATVQKGALALVVRPDRLLSSLSSQTQRDGSGLRVCLLQLQPGELPQTLSCPAGGSAADCLHAAPHDLQTAFPLFPFGKPYVLCITPDEDWLAAHPLQQARMVLFSGLALSALLTVLIGILANRPRLLEQEVGKRTAELRESQARLALATEAGGIGVWDRDIINNRLLWDDRMFELYGVRKEDFGGAYEAWQQHLHPDDVDRVCAEVAAAENGDKPFDTEFRILRPDGEVRHLRAFARAIRDRSGKPLRMIGTNQDITALRKIEQELLQFSWLLEKEKGGATTSVTPEYEDITALNKDGLILKSVGKTMLQNIANDIMALLDTCMAVYEKNGDYAFGTFVSTWCGTLDNASRALCKTDDNTKALACGKWCCHESCWAISKEAIDSGVAVDRACTGGIQIYAVPVWAENEIIGAVNFGYGTPPNDPARLSGLANEYQLPVEKIHQAKQAYRPRPPFIIETAKQHLHSIAQLIRQTVERHQNEEALRQHNVKLERFNQAAVGRELRMIELKKEINALSRELGREEPYSAQADA